MSLKPCMTHYSLFMKHFFNLCLPQSCALCGDKTDSAIALCLACQKDLPILSHSCEKCAHFLALSEKICGFCLSDPPPFDRTVALFSYEPPVTQLIVRLKFKQQLHIATALAALFLRHLQRMKISKPDLILPMPLHSSRLQERGFNQAVELARPLAKALGRPLDLTGAMRLKPTLAQSHLSRLARKENMERAFRVTRSYAGLSLAVVDDVMTTGQTMRALCRQLKEKGAKRIEVWCFARS